MRRGGAARGPRTHGALANILGTIVWRLFKNVVTFPATYLNYQRLIEPTHEVWALQRDFIKWSPEMKPETDCMTPISGSLAIESMADCFLVWETTRRNSGLVTRAAEFVSGHRLDRRYAAALEVVGCCPPLLEEFAQQQSLTVVDATPIIQRALRSIESMHDFMRLVGVVRERVVCHPRKDGRRQLDDLDDDCWRLIRRHITLFDVGTRTTHSSLMDL
ncbi:uncharacterized protein LOC142568673 isoform X5 [Dermacentor variabilis]|uniref:uncharacterized protein LOC142568673 isoform X5 n=1 Tax=Dermacentor variabilis TaxID=34621 RepID=UPI003F5ADEC8